MGTRTATRRARTLVGVMAALALLLAGLGAQSAGAETTHRFLRNLTLPVNEVMPLGVDPAGNVIVYVEEDATIRKFSSNGTPVDFTALGTNVIDGLGTGNCPAVPSDCDETPASILPEGIGRDSGFIQEIRLIPADMNQSTEGPSAGYIYVTASREVAPEDFEWHLIAFDPSGVYRGEVDLSQVSPVGDPPGTISHVVNVSPGGTLYVLNNETRHIDKFQAVDGNPAHDLFVGQLRRTTNGPGLNEGGIGNFVADDFYVYVRKYRDAVPLWSKYDPDGFTVPSDNALPINLSPTNCVCNEAGPWLNGGLNEETGNSPFESAVIDPATHNVILFDAYSGYMSEWTVDNERVGQLFAGPDVLNPLAQVTNYTRPLAVDATGGPTHGRIYVQSANDKLAVFGPQVVVPDVEDLDVVPTHQGGIVSATVDLAHGPKATVCRVQWGQESSPGAPVEYNNSVPCDPAAPFTDEQTDVEVELTGLTTEQSYRVRIQVKTLNGQTLSQPVQLRPPAVLAVDTKPATDVTRTEAVLHGSLDADGIATEYWFEYGIDTNYRNKTAAASAGSASGSTDVPPIEITNLQSGRPYHFRLVAQNSLGTTFGPDQEFNAASSPVIAGVRATDVAEVSATLHATVNPSGFDTSYRFEYGTSPSYGLSTPATPENIGDGTEPVAVSRDLSGLEPGVTYHFRVVATNEWGTSFSEDSTFDFFPPTCPNDYVRQLTGAAYLPDCRAYELVSPGNAGGVALLPGNSFADTRILKNTSIPHLKIPDPNPGTAVNPPRFSFIGAIGGVAGTNPPNSLVDFYTSTRTQQGWETNYWGQKGNEAAFVGGYQCSLDGSICIDYRLPDVTGEDESDVGSLAPYVWTATGKSLGRWPTNFNVVKDAEDYLGADRPSPDFSHYVFSSRNIAFAEGGMTKAPGSVYDNDIGEATISIASRLAGGEDIPQDTGTNVESVQVPAISTDGSHILMSVLGSGGSHFYMRVGGEITYDLLGGNVANFVGMTDDGSRVFFSSRQQLTADDTDSFAFDIFEWSEETQELKKVSQGNGQGNREDCSADGVFRCGATPITPERGEIDDVVASESGDVYFFSPEQLDPDNPGVFNEKNLYTVHDGAVKYVATLDPGTTVNRMQISPDGKFSAFLTTARLTSYDNQGWRAMYSFDVDTGLLRCVSCNPSGAPPFVRPPLTPNRFGASPEAYEKPSAHVIASQSGRFMTDDGRVAFTTSDALVEADTNALTDVYEYVNGRARLISSGTGQKDKWAGNILFPAEYTGLEAISHDGTDIYFSTFDTLTPEDLNGNFVKFYDARSGGGFRTPAEELPCVAADECHGDENPSPQAATIGTTAALGGGGNVANAPAAKKGKKAKRKRAAKKRKAAKKRAARRHKGGGNGRG